VTSSIPSYPYDIFTDEVLLSPYEHYAALRELGPVAWLEAHQVYALPRYAEVRAVLSAPETFCSGQGVGMNEMVNTIGQGTTLMSDGEQHRVQRLVLAHRLMPRALRPMREMIQARADELADVLVRQRRFDAVSDLARALPLSIVPDLVGWPENGREHLLDWASAAFDSLGPMNARAEQAGPRVQAMFEFAARTTAERNVLPDSAAAEMLEAVDSGQLSPEQATSLVIDYVAPSLDTTISAIGSAIWLFAENPEQWKTLQAGPPADRERLRRGRTAGITDPRLHPGADDRRVCGRNRPARRSARCRPC
jgi:cytochrome P450